jgi:hypothetical protein
VVGVRECAGMPVNDVAKIDDSVRVAQRQQKKSESASIQYVSNY